MSIDFFNLPDAPVTVILQHLWLWGTAYVMWHCNSHGYNRSSIRPDFLAFTAHIRRWLGSPNFCIFLSSPKADKIKILHSTVHKIRAGYLWKNIPIVEVCQRGFSTPFLRENFRMDWFHLLSEKGIMCE